MAAPYHLRCTDTQSKPNYAPDGELTMLEGWLEQEVSNGYVLDSITPFVGMDGSVKLITITRCQPNAAAAIRRGTCSLADAIRRQEDMSNG